MSEFILESILKSAFPRLDFFNNERALEESKCGLYPNMSRHAHTKKMCYYIICIFTVLKMNSSKCTQYIICIMNIERNE